MAGDPIEFTRDQGSIVNQRCGNRVQLEDADGNPINQLNPLPIDTGATALAADVRFLDENGVAYGIKHIQNKPRFSSMPYSFDISEGNVTDHIPLHVEGEVLGVSTTYGDMWGASPGTLVCPVLSAAVAMEAIGGAQDNPAGTGVSKIDIHYLDTNGDAQDHELTLNGAAAVALPENVLHINDVHITEGGAGSGDPVVASANIDIRGTGGGTVYARIPSGTVRAPRFVFRVPRAYTGYWVDLVPSVIALANNSDAQLRVVANMNLNDLSVLPVGVWIPLLTISGGAAGSTFGHSQSFPFKFPAGVIIKGQAKRGSGSGLANGHLTGSGWIEA